MKLSSICITLLFFLSSVLFSQPDKELEKIKEAAPNSPSAKPKKKRQILVYSKPSGFKHSSIPTGVKGLRVLSEKTQAFDVTFTIETKEFSTEGLKKYDAIIFNNTTHVQKAFTEKSQRDAILNFIKNGKAFIGFHAASDGGMPQWQEYTDMIGDVSMGTHGMPGVNGLSSLKTLSIL